MKKILTVLLATMLVFTVVSCSLFMEEKDNSGSLVSFRLNTKGAKGDDTNEYGAEEYITYGESTVLYGSWTSVDWEIRYVVTADGASTPTNKTSYTQLYEAPFRVQKGQKVWAYCENTSKTSINAPVVNSTTVTSLLKAEGLFKGTADAVVRETKTYIILVPELDEGVAFDPSSSTVKKGNVKIDSIKYVLSDYQRAVITTNSDLKKIRVIVDVDGITTECDAEFTTDSDDGGYEYALFENIVVENVPVSKSGTTPSNIKLKFVGIKEDGNEVSFNGPNDNEFNVFELSNEAQTGIADIYVINGLTTEMAYITVENKEIRLAIVEIEVTTSSNFTGDYDSMPNFASVALVSDKGRYLSITDLRVLTTASDAPENVAIGSGTVKLSGTDFVYENNTAQHVAIVTDGQTLYVNAPNDTITHFGDANVIDISAVADNSFHEFGQAKEVKLATGRFVAESGSKVETLKVENTAALVELGKGSAVKALDLPGDYASTNVTIKSVAETYIPVVKVNGSFTTPSDFFQGVAGVPSTLPVAKITSGTDERCFNSLADAVADVKDNETITLNMSTTISKTCEVGKKNVTLDLNGFNVTPADNWNGNDSMIVVLRGGQLIINDTSASKNGSVDVSSKTINAAIKLTKKGESKNGEKAEFTLQDGKLVGYYYGITGNGSRQNTAVTINGGLVKGTKENDSAGIYNPQDGTLVITGGTIEGAVGIYVKSGTTTVGLTGGTIKGVATSLTDYASKNDGFVATGDAVVFDNCDYPGGVPNASITGGTFESKCGYAIASYAKSGMTAISGFVSGGTLKSVQDSPINNTNIIKIGYDIGSETEDSWTVSAN